jgi:hypothetical protein
MVLTGRMMVGSVERWLAGLCETGRYYVYLAPFRTINGSDTAEIRISFIFYKTKNWGTGGILVTTVLKFCKYM